MFLLFMAKGLPSANTLNAPFVAAEVLNILVGSFGLVTVAPFTVLVSGLLYRFEVKDSSPADFHLPTDQLGCRPPQNDGRGIIMPYKIWNSLISLPKNTRGK
jgi:hypothetical protein